MGGEGKNGGARGTVTVSNDGVLCWTIISSEDTNKKYTDINGKKNQNYFIGSNGNGGARGKGGAGHESLILYPCPINDLYTIESNNGDTLPTLTFGGQDASIGRRGGGGGASIFSKGGNGGGKGTDGSSGSYGSGGGGGGDSGHWEAAFSTGAGGKGGDSMVFIW